MITPATPGRPPTMPTQPAGELLIMPTDEAEYRRMRDTHDTADCRTCYAYMGGGPVHWPLFSYCQGGNGPGKPIHPHCTCDNCF